MSNIKAAISQLCLEISEAEKFNSEEVKDFAEAVRYLSQAYSLIMDADLAKRNLDMHEQQYHQLPGEAPVSGAN